MPTPRENAYNLVVCPPKVTKLKRYKLPADAYKCCEFRENNANESPVRGKFVAKFANFDSFGVFPHFCPHKREIWHAVRSPCQTSRLSGQRVAPAGRNTLFVLLSKKQYRHGCASRRTASNKTNNNLAIANRSRVSCAHNTLRASISINITP